MSKKSEVNSSASIRLIILITVLIILFIVSFAIAYKFAVDNGSNDDESIINIDPEKGIAVEVPLGANTGKIVEILEKKGLVDSPLKFKLISKLNGYDENFKSGTHILSKDLEYADMMKVLSSNPVSIKARVKEGSTINEVADILLKAKVITDKAAFIKASNTEKFNYKFLQGLPNRESKLEGYLFPDTYEFGLKASNVEVLKVILDNFNNRFQPDYYEKIKMLNEKFPKLKMDVDKLITVASIIEKESSTQLDRSMIARVFYNRLMSGDPSMRKLQSCTTIQYIYFNRKTDIPEADKLRIAQGKILDKDTKIEDPFNTYKFEGLPPGPISSPSKAAIEAALNPDDNASGYYYFVAKGDGTHAFASNYAEHETNRIKYEKK